jgi:hypothetical protein
MKERRFRSTLEASVTLQLPIELEWNRETSEWSTVEPP